MVSLPPVNLTETGVEVINVGEINMNANIGIAQLGCVLSVERRRMMNKQFWLAQLYSAKLSRVYPLTTEEERAKQKPAPEKKDE